MAEEYVATVALNQADVDAALKAVNDRVTAVGMSAASNGASIASMQSAIDRLEASQGMGDTQVSLLYTQVSKLGASIGMARAEIAGANKLYLEAQAECINHLVDIYRRVTTFCFLCGAAFVALAVVLWLKT